MRDVLQIISVLISIFTLMLVYRRVKKYHERARDWIAFIVISLLTMFFYIAVLFDQSQDFMNASDVSSSLRLSVQIALMLYVAYQPRRITL